MAAYAVFSAIRVTGCYLISSSSKFLLPKPQELVPIFKDLHILDLFLSYLRDKNLRAIALEQKIEDVADRIEHVMGSLLSSDSGNQSSWEFYIDVLQLKHELSCLTDKLWKEEIEIQEDIAPVSFLAADDELLMGRYDSIEGSRPIVVLANEIEELKDEVMAGSSHLTLTTVEGMAGIGKTTLANLVCFHLKSEFEIQPKLTFGPNFTLRRVLGCFVTAIGFPECEILGDNELGSILKCFLTGKKYLALIDNFWDWRMWKQLSMFFPDDGIGSRIIITTREKLHHCSPLFNGSINKSYQKRFMRDDASWRLLHDVIFTAKESCSSHLAEIGMKIAKKCEGLPLAILTMGELLRNGEKTIERWNKVLEDDDPLLIDKDDGRPISKSLHLSYAQLSYEQRLCFLYIGVLPLNYKIYVSRIIELCIAEGFTLPIKNTIKLCLYYPIRKHLLKLDELSMIENVPLHFVHDFFAKQYRVHFTFRSFCIREARNEKFCLVVRKYVDMLQHDSYIQPRLFLHNNILLGFKEVHNYVESISPRTSSILYCGPQHIYPLQVCLNFKLLKVLNALSIRFYEFPREVLK